MKGLVRQQLVKPSLHYTDEKTIENHQIFFYTGLKTDLNSKQKLIVGNIKPSSELPAYLSEI